jgi:hypothetical protein
LIFLSELKKKDAEKEAEEKKAQDLEEADNMKTEGNVCKKEQDTD